MGYNAICNVRIAGADIGGNTAGGKRKIPMVAIIATGTAYRASKDPASSWFSGNWNFSIAGK